MEKKHQSEDDEDHNKKGNLPTYIKYLEKQRDKLIKNENYTKAQEYDQKIEVYKAKEDNLKTKSLKRIYSLELLELNDDYNTKHKALVKKWEFKEKEMANIIGNKLNALSLKHNKEKETITQSSCKTLNNTTSSSFYKSARRPLNQFSVAYLNIKKTQEMIFKRKNRDYTLAEQLKKESQKILKEEQKNKLIKMQKNFQKDYYRLIKRQEEELVKLKYEIKSNVDLMNSLKEKEFELLNQTLKNKTKSIRRSMKIEELFLKKIDKYRQSKCSVL